MKLKGSLIGFALITCLYLGLLIWLDARKQVFAHLPQIWQPLLAMMGMALASFTLRFARWQWLLSRLGHRPPLMYSFLAYLSGFVFTATPGKVGELVRIRYLSPAGVPPKDTISIFVFERLFDLLAVLILAAFHTDRADLLAVALVFVLLVAGVVFLCSTHPSLLDKIINALRQLHAPRAAHWLQTLRDGLLHCRQLTTPLNALISLAGGLLAWLLTSLACIHLLHQLSILLPFQTALSLYPIAMLVGAASMLPGGIGSTEATLTLLLTSGGAPLATAAAAAVCIRIATLWFSIVLGFISMGLLSFLDVNGVPSQP